MWRLLLSQFLVLSDPTHQKAVLTRQLSPVFIINGLKNSLKLAARRSDQDPEPWVTLYHKPIQKSEKPIE